MITEHFLSVCLDPFIMPTSQRRARGLPKVPKAGWTPGQDPHIMAKLKPHSFSPFWTENSHESRTFQTLELLEKGLIRGTLA